MSSPVIPFLLILLIPFLLGCGDGGKSSEELAACSVVQDFARAIADQDMDACMDCFFFDPETQNSFEKFLTFMVKGTEFKNKMISTYGEQGWKEFNEAPGFEIKVSWKHPDIGDLRAEIEGDSAKVWKPENIEEVLLLKRVEGEWKIDATASFMGIEESLADMFNRFVEVMEAYMPRIGEPGVTPASLSKAMGNQVGSEMGSSFTENRSP